MLRPLLVLVTALCSAAPALAQGVPDPVIPYQGRLTDAAGSPLTQTGLAVTFTLYDDATDGTALWTETDAVDVEDGTFTTTLGDGTALDGVDFGQDLWLGLEVADEALTPRVRVGAVPKALFAPGDGGGLAFPFAGTDASDAAAAFRVTKTGDSGRAALFETLGDSDGDAVTAFVATGGGGAAVRGRTQGSGPAGVFEVDNTGNASPALLARTAGGGNVLEAEVGGSTVFAVDAAGVADAGGLRLPDGTLLDEGADLGLALPFSGTASASESAFRVEQGGSGSAVAAANNGTGYGISASSANSDGLYASALGGPNNAAVRGTHFGTGAAGSFELVSGQNASAALRARTPGSGPALWLRSNGGSGAVVERAAGSGLEVQEAGGNGVHVLSADAYGVQASGSLAGAYLRSTDAGDPLATDLVLGDGYGVIQSEPGDPLSGLFLVSNSSVGVALDNDGDGSGRSLTVFSPEGLVLEADAATGNVRQRPDRLGLVKAWASVECDGDDSVINAYESAYGDVTVHVRDASDDGCELDFGFVPNGWVASVEYREKGIDLTNAGVVNCRTRGYPGEPTYLHCEIVHDLAGALDDTATIRVVVF